MSYKPIKTKIDKALPLSEVYRLDKIFLKKGWPKETCFDNKVFDNFCKTLAKYTPEQRELIFSLTNDFIWIQPENYMPYFDELFSEFISSYNFESKPESISEEKSKSNKKSRPKIRLCPLLAKDDTNKVKSSTTLLYLIKGQIKAIQKKYSNYDIFIKDDPTKNIKNEENNRIFCLVDDFLGTGKTAENAVSILNENGVSTNRIVVLVLVGMKEGIEFLRTKNIAVFAHFICNKGITGNKNDTDKLRIMEEIEKEIKVKKEYNFGYESSESLVRMIRTPNNTFPFFWLWREKHDAPFPR